MASRGLDDLELDGNWVPLGGAEGAAPAGPAEKRLQLLDAEDDDDDAAEVGDRSKRRKKKRRKAFGGGGPDAVAAPDWAAGPEQLSAWACSRLEAAWAEEAKAKQLAPLEAKELRLQRAWFQPCIGNVPIARLPWQLGSGDFAATSRALRTLVAIREGASLPSPLPGSVSVLVLCTSVDRVFAVVGEIEEAWSARPLALSAHGGGRKREQIARQARAVAQGAALAVGTPGRVLRLFQEGHARLVGLEAVVLDLCRDMKQRDLLTQSETRRELFALLRSHLAEALSQDNGPRLVLCGGGEPAAQAQ